MLKVSVDTGRANTKCASGTTETFENRSGIHIHVPVVMGQIVWEFPEPGTGPGLLPEILRVKVIPLSRLFRPDLRSKERDI